MRRIIPKILLIAGLATCAGDPYYQYRQLSVDEQQKLERIAQVAIRNGAFWGPSEGTTTYVVELDKARITYEDSGTKGFSDGDRITWSASDLGQSGLMDIFIGTSVEGIVAVELKGYGLRSRRQSYRASHPQATVQDVYSHLKRQRSEELDQLYQQATLNMSP